MDTQQLQQLPISHTRFLLLVKKTSKDGWRTVFAFFFSKNIVQSSSWIYLQVRLKKKRSLKGKRFSIYFCGKSSSICIPAGSDAC